MTKLPIIGGTRIPKHFLSEVPPTQNFSVLLEHIPKRNPCFLWMVYEILCEDILKKKKIKT